MVAAKMAGIARKRPKLAALWGKFPITLARLAHA